MQQEVQVKLKTSIVDNDIRENNEVKELGELYIKEHGDMIVYEEKLDNEEQAKVKNIVTIQPDKVLIRRSGAVKMKQLFQVGKRSESVFHHPHGRMHMETFTKSIAYHPLDEQKQGKLTINYTVKLNGQEAREHFLEIILEK